MISEIKAIWKRWVVAMFATILVLASAGGAIAGGAYYTQYRIGKDCDQMGSTRIFNYVWSCHMSYWEQIKVFFREKTTDSNQFVGRTRPESETD